MRTKSLQVGVVVGRTLGFDEIVADGVIVGEKDGRMLGELEKLGADEGGQEEAELTARSNESLKITSSIAVENASFVLLSMTELREVDDTFILKSTKAQEMGRPKSTLSKQAK